MKDLIFIIFLTLLTIFLLGFAHPVTESSSLGDPELGQEIYDSNGCGACHRINGLGGTIGPDLTEVWKKGDEYIRESIFEPRKVVVKGYKPVMPSFKKVLTESDVDNIIAYLKSLKKKGKK